jgi:hypothetical protein
MARLFQGHSNNPQLLHQHCLLWQVDGLGQHHFPQLQARYQPEMGPSLMILILALSNMCFEEKG